MTFARDAISRGVSRLEGAGVGDSAVGVRVEGAATLMVVCDVKNNHYITRTGCVDCTFVFLRYLAFMLEMRVLQLRVKNRADICAALISLHLGISHGDLWRSKQGTKGKTNRHPPSNNVRQNWRTNSEQSCRALHSIDPMTLMQAIRQHTAHKLLNAGGNEGPAYN